MRHKAYYKARRLKSRHAKHHTPWCNCPEMLWWTRRAISRYVQRLKDEGMMPCPVKVPVQRGPRADYSIADEIQHLPRQREAGDDAC